MFDGRQTTVSYTGMEPRGSWQNPPMLRAVLCKGSKQESSKQESSKQALLSLSVVRNTRAVSQVFISSALMDVKLLSMKAKDYIW
jgi:hypothetical protein